MCSKIRIVFPIVTSKCFGGWLQNPSEILLLIFKFFRADFASSTVQFLWMELKFKTVLYISKRGEKHISFYKFRVHELTFCANLHEVLYLSCERLPVFSVHFHNGEVSSIAPATGLEISLGFFLKLHVNYYWRKLCEILKKLSLFLYYVKFNSLETQIMALLCFFPS